MEKSSPAAQGRKPKARFRVDIKTEWCKGCTICVEFCPKDVLAMDGLVATVKNPENCIGCEICDVLCPDFAVTVHRLEPESSKGV